jgi:hypothetical protein
MNINLRNLKIMSLMNFKLIAKDPQPSDIFLIWKDSSLNCPPRYHMFCEMFKQSIYSCRISMVCLEGIP